MKKDTARETKKKFVDSRPAVQEASRIVNRSELQSSLKDLNKLLTQARIRPYRKGGKAEGLSLTRIKRDSAFAELGLKNGDILQGINGRSIKRPNDIGILYEKLKSGSHVSLRVTRRGEQKILNYRFE